MMHDVGVPDADEVGLGPVLTELTGPGGEFEMIEQAVGGRSVRVYSRGPKTLRELVSVSHVFGSRTFTIYEGERRSYGEWLDLVAALARELRSGYGLKRGDRVGIAMRNLPEWSVVFFAAQAAGLVSVPLNAFWSSSELAWAVHDSGCSTVFADSERAPELASRTDAITVRVRGGDTPLRGVHEWGQLRLEDRALREPGLPPVDVFPDDLSTILYTSGTTGRPKGSIATHRNHCVNLLNVALYAAAGAAVSGARAPAEPGLLLTYPMFHIAGLNGLIGALYSGSKIVTQHRWSPSNAWSQVKSEGLTHAAGVPSTMRSLVSEAALDNDAHNALRVIRMGGAPIPRDLVEQIRNELPGVSPINGYGLTETTAAVCVNAGADYFERPDSVGRPVPGAQIRVVAASGNDVECGDVGELWFRGSNVSAGYWNSPSGNAESFIDGWFRTGDLGYVDQGWVYVVDRIKDVVLRGGENVYSAQVEDAIYQIPGVLETAVFGLPHPTLGEEVAAAVHAEPGMTRNDDAVRTVVRDRVGSFASPAHIFWVDEPLPRTATGKVLKADLRASLHDR